MRRVRHKNRELISPYTRVLHMQTFIYLTSARINSISSASETILQTAIYLVSSTARRQRSSVTIFICARSTRSDGMSLSLGACGCDRPKLPLLDQRAVGLSIHYPSQRRRIAVCNWKDALDAEHFAEALNASGQLSGLLLASSQKSPSSSGLKWAETLLKSIRKETIGNSIVLAQNSLENSL